MDLSDAKITITKSRELIHINGELVSFRSQFNVTSLKSEPFRALIVSQTILDSAEEPIVLRNAPKGIFSGTITENSGKKDLWYIAIEADAEIEAVLNVHTEPVETFVPEQASEQKDTQPPPAKKKGLSFWVIALIIGAVLLIGFILYKFLFKGSSTAPETAPFVSFVPKSVTPKLPEIPAPVAPVAPIPPPEPPVVEPELNVDFSDLPPI